MRVSVTLDRQQVEEIRGLVPGTSMPAFVRNAVRVAIADAREWREMLDEALDRTGGPLTEEEIAWADGVLGSGKRAPGRTRLKKTRSASRLR